MLRKPGQTCWPWASGFYVLSAERLALSSGVPSAARAPSASMAELGSGRHDLLAQPDREPWPAPIGITRCLRRVQQLELPTIPSSLAITRARGTDREPQPRMLASAAPGAGTTCSSTTARAHLISLGTALASSTTGVSHDLGCSPDPDLPRRKDAVCSIGKTRSSSNTTEEPLGPVAILVSEPRSSLDTTREPQPDWLELEPLGPPRYHRLRPRRPRPEQQRQPRSPARATRRIPRRQPPRPPHAARPRRPPPARTPWPLLLQTAKPVRSPRSWLATTP